MNASKTLLGRVPMAWPTLALALVTVGGWAALVVAAWAGLVSWPLAVDHGRRRPRLASARRTSHTSTELDGPEVAPLQPLLGGPVGSESSRGSSRSPTTRSSSGASGWSTDGGRSTARSPT